MLVVTFRVPLVALADYELVEEGRTYREWCIPAPLATARLLGVIRRRADAKASTDWWAAAEPSPVLPGQ